MKISEYCIRLATMQDIPALIDLCEAHAAFEGCDYDRGGKAERLSSCLFADNASIKCLVLVINNEICGYATYCPEFSTWDAAYYMHMDCLYLKEEVRAKGYGSMMIRQIQKEASALGLSMQWQTPSDNVNAIKFYTRLGALSKSKMRFYWSY